METHMSLQIVHRLTRGCGLALTAAEADLLANDLQEIAREDQVSLREASDTLLRRIGGFRNLPSYIDTLMAGGRAPRVRVCPLCAAHYGDAGVCDEGKPASSPHRDANGKHLPYPKRR
jgi:hypothetical protein